jgi:hypothetical protein
MSIFVSVASYCDDLLLQTLRDCHAKAAHPEALHFGVVDQDDTDQREGIDALPFRGQIHYVHVNALDARGAAWARHVAFSLFDDEDHLLQIDAHTIFEPEWDRQLIAQLRELQAIAPKPIVTTYPPRFDMVDGKPVTRPWTPGTMFTLRPDRREALTLDAPAVKHVGVQQRSTRPLPGTHIAAGFFFTLGAFVEEVPYDPFLYFMGEEHDLAVRAFTRGWDVFHPPRVPLFHRYRENGQSERGQHWNRAIDERRPHPWHAFESRSTKRLKRLFFGRGLPGAYGLGHARTLDDFRRASGIDYRRMTVDPRHVERPLGLDAMRPQPEGPRRVGVLVPGTGRPDDARRALLELMAQLRRPDVVVFVQHDGAPNFASFIADLDPPFEVHWVHHASFVDARTAFASGLVRLLERGATLVVVTTTDLHRSRFVEASVAGVDGVEVAFGHGLERVVLARGEPEREETSDATPAIAGASFTRTFAEVLMKHLEAQEEGSVDDALRALLADGWSSSRIATTTTLRVEDRR